jgi:hypothetical protein
MAAITVTAAQVALGGPPHQHETYSFDAAEAIAAGQAVYVNSNGKVALADASAAGTLILAGIALNAAGAGQGVSVIKQGFVSGFDVSGMAYGDPAYVSDTAGGLDTTAGTVTKIIGRVSLGANQAGNPQKALYVQSDWN